MIQSFLHTHGRQIVDESNQPILMKGWGIGNWLLQEGYMWGMHGQKFDRPRRIERTIEELVGHESAAHFWQEFRNQYMNEDDINYIQAQGYNSIRLPFNAALFLTESGEIDETNFYLIDRFIEWAKKHDLYVWLDMHGAPGGQTGANIDDSTDDIPNLFMVQSYWQQAIKLWRFIAERYHDEPAVAGYDLLNEPIRPETAALQNFDYLLPKLSQFYTETIAAIREVDQKHMFSLEGYHWASDPSVFVKKYDDNFVIHFHRYGVLPTNETFEDFLKVSEQFNVPLWLGETGENINTWFSGMSKLCEEYEVSYHFWPYKKLGKNNGSLTIKTPDNWDALTDYVEKGIKPDRNTVNELLDQYLENCQFKNCQQNQDVDHHILRKAPFSYSATAFDDQDYHATTIRNNFKRFRQGTNIEILAPKEQKPSHFSFDVYLDEYRVRLNDQEYVTYSFEDVSQNEKLILTIDIEDTQKDARLEIIENHQLTQVISGLTSTVEVTLNGSFETDRVQIKALDGYVALHTITLA